MLDRRNDSVTVRILRVALFLLSVAVAVILFGKAGTMYGDPTSELARYREPAVFPHVFVRGTLDRRSSDDLPALCAVNHERWTSCGKNSHCWTYQEGFLYSNGKIDITWSSSPLPATMSLDASFHNEPWPFPANVVNDPRRFAAWKNFAEKNKLGFNQPSFTVMGNNDRIVEYCVDKGDAPVFIEACVSPTRPGFLEKCPGQPHYGVILNGDPQAAIDDAADGIAARIGLAMIALFVGALAWFRKRKPLLDGLENRAAAHRKKLGIAWALLGVPPLAAFVALTMHASHPPSTYTTGRGGFALAISAMAMWLFYAVSRILARRRTLFALAPVLATERSLLSAASGTVELAVKARLRNGGVRAFIGDDVVAYSEIKITETYRQGKGTSSAIRAISRQANELEVVDESGVGTLDLQRSILDVELRSVTMTELSPRYAERGIVVERVKTHVNYAVEEHVIKDGESLYVFGDVSNIALTADEAGYRSVRGAPTLGGADAAPVLVYSGDERGLIAMLSREARLANSFAVVAICVCAALACSLVALAEL